MLKEKIQQKTQLLNEVYDKAKPTKNTIKLEIEKDHHKYTISIMKEEKTSANSGDNIEYKLSKQKASNDFESHNSSVTSMQTLELINTIENLKDKYKRLSQLKEKNDEKLMIAKQKIENLKSKNGAELIEELGIITKNKKQNAQELLDK